MSEAINVQVIKQEIRERVQQQTTIQEPKPVSTLPCGLRLPDLSDMESVSEGLDGRQTAVSFVFRNIYIVLNLRPKSQCPASDGKVIS